MGPNFFTRKRSAVRICQVPLPHSILINKELRFKRNVPPSAFLLAISAPKVGHYGALWGTLLGVFARSFVNSFHLCKNSCLQIVCREITDNNHLLKGNIYFNNHLLEGQSTLIFMANIYIFWDGRSPRKDGTGTLKLALTHKRKTVYESLGVRIKKDEWDADKHQVIQRPDKKFLNVQIRKRLSDAEIALERIKLRKDFEDFDARGLLTLLMRGTDTADTPEDSDYVIPVYNEYITLARKTTTAQLYRYSLKNLMDFAPDIDTLRFKDINTAWLRRYQQWMLEQKKMEVNGANVYLRNLRAIFNFALQNEYTKARYPFKSIDMSTTEPDKRMIPYDKFLEFLSFPLEDNRIFYRDMFLLSFYLCGIRPVDLLHVKKSQIEDGRLEYCPEKLNGRTKLSIKVEPEAWEIIHKYEGKEYLIDVMEGRKDYKEFCKNWNRALKAIGKDIPCETKGKGGYTYTKIIHEGVVPYITAYYARTCWASIAYNELDIPMDIISQALGHKSGLRVTNFYVKRDVSKVDKANRKLIDKVKEDLRKLA